MEPKYGICQHVCCYASHISLIVGIVLHGQAVLSVGPNPNPLVRPQTPLVSRYAVFMTSIASQYPLTWPQVANIPHHKEASY